MITEGIQALEEFAAPEDSTPTHAMLRQRLWERAGLFPPPVARVSAGELARSEWSPQFERLMRNRLIIGALRHGRLRAIGKPAYDRIQGALKRLFQYRQTGNLEALVDVANLMLLEFEECRHPRAHFDSLNADHCCV